MRRFWFPAFFAAFAGIAGAQTGEVADVPPTVGRSPFSYPPISVAPPVIEVPRAIALPAPPQVPAPVAVPRATVITSCDSGGCWDAEGRRLNIVGPALVGPGGTCTAQAGVVRCP